ncbi:AMP-binding protein [Dyadobacter crusticola]|uniref:AMP-binding protein n=1 Tax=Dyadobacter crusticola TaxID=292407 RepID=UPI0004E26D6A|nr:AMP-binding protein [Dyadobacter crusticola]
MFLPADFWEKPRPQDVYLGKAHDFMRKWKSGESEFTLHTSGSTGTPKPIVLTRKQMVTSAMATGRALNLTRGTRALVCLNIGYIAGLMMLVRGMELDWQITVIEPASNPLLLTDEAAQFDFTALVPMQLASILEHPATRDKVSTLGKILLGGAPVNAGLQQQIATLQAPVYQSYGLTETVSHIALRRLNCPEEEIRYTFLPGVQFGADERGCLFVTGDVTNGEVVQTNDLVEIENNTFQWIGRADNVINSGGVKIVLDKVDAAVANVFARLNIPNIHFTWWEPDQKLGQKLVLVIEGELQSVHENSVMEEIRRQVSAYETPKHTYFVKQFIKTPTGKIDKRRTFSTVSVS